MSKELEALNYLVANTDLIPEDLVNFKIVEHALKRKEKLERVFEIIKNKPYLANLDFQFSFEEQCKFYYFSYFSTFNRAPEEKFPCTEEEYELLKEVFRSLL